MVVGTLGGNYGRVPEPSSSYIILIYNHGLRDRLHVDHPESPQKPQGIASRR